MNTACWVPKATNTLTEYVLLTASPLQQWLRESSSLLSYTNIVHFFISNLVVLKVTSCL
jgi:hypothetical protein